MHGATMKYVMKAYEGTPGTPSCIFVISTLHLGERSASRPCRFIAGEREPISIKSKIWRGGVKESLSGLFEEEILFAVCRVSKRGSLIFCIKFIHHND